MTEEKSSKSHFLRMNSDKNKFQKKVKIRLEDWAKFLKNITKDTTLLFFSVSILISIALMLYQCWIIITTYNKIKNNPEEYKLYLFGYI